MVTKPELLAPAGDTESLIAAVESGCDAVYLGATTLSARASAANFAPDELADAIDYAHLRGVEAYVAVNTLVKDSETDGAADLLRHLDESGADAVIVQDVGLLSLARSLAPDLPIHASTQMTVHNSEGAGFLQDMGVTRVVLAREMTLDAIKQVMRNTDLEIEIFVHGALCISYSGQCLMSSMIGGRSGNRGVCAQPCRKRYRIRSLPGRRDVKTDGEYLLSPRDLNTSRILPELIEAGIDSFKIEGRLKRPEYVACVTRIYRGLIDRYIKDPAGYFVTGDEARSLAQVFNRGFTGGYLTGNPRGELMSRMRPYNRGIPLGTVIECDRTRLCIKLSGTLRIGDGVGITSAAGADGGGLADDGVGVGADDDGSGTIVRQMYADGRQVDRADSGTVVDIPMPYASSAARVRAGSTVYKTFDKALMDSLRSSFTSHVPLRRIPVTITAEVAVGSPLGLRIEDNDNNAVYVHSEYVIERAVSRPTTGEEIVRQLAKLGNTVFKVSESDIDLRIEGGGGIFIPVSQLNRVRNDAVLRLADARIVRWRRGARARHRQDRSADFAGTLRTAEPRAQVADASKRSPPAVSLAVSVSDMDGVRSAIAGGADVIYLGGERYRGAAAEAFNLETAIRCVHQSGRRIYLNTPGIASDSQMRGVADAMSDAAKFGADGVLVSNHGVFRLAEEMGLDVVVDSPLNVFNRMSLEFWVEHGAGLVTLSPELTLAEIREIAKYGAAECIVHGRLTLMESEHCVVGGILGGADSCAARCENGGFELVDEKGYAFPLQMDTDCRMHLLNSSELCMLDHIHKIVRTGVSSIRIDARGVESERAGVITRLYRAALDGESARDDKIQSTCESITGEYTTGHYRRGVV
uniref:Peptidase U32 collagenase domain-containing protein n=1 Tax=Candidatus Methanogaster sp. ANME-2c ERB4 TaxID=2759911 RepID=A0A7G9YPS2_9EURY|nr:hypothetical protein CAGMOKBG_00026 [Methanosarcinales archaeon ANME-2c ERB4]